MLDRVYSLIKKIFTGRSLSCGFENFHLTPASQLPQPCVQLKP
jgi:hypothetical protein